MGLGHFLFDGTEINIHASPSLFTDSKGSLDKLDYTALLVSAIVMGGLIIISIIIGCVVCIVKGRKRKAVAKTATSNSMYNPR